LGIVTLMTMIALFAVLTLALAAGPSRRLALLLLSRR
jgi:hypothetical protein